jgi:hypothetical protein
MHPGRVWALDEILEDKMSVQLISKGIEEHFTINPPFRSRARIVHQLLSEFVQSALVIDTASISSSTSIETVEFG